MNRLVLLMALWMAPGWAAAGNPAPAPAPAPSQTPAAPPPAQKQLTASPVSGKPAEKSKEKEDEEGPAAPAPPELFDEALRFHYAGLAKEAAPKFYTFIRGTPRTNENYPWAQLFMAQDLAALGYTHAAITYAGMVAKDRARPEVVPEALKTLEKLTAEVPYDHDFIDRDVIHGSDFGALPTDVLDFVNFHQGVLDYKDGYLKWAEKHFEQVKGGEYLARAKMVKAVQKLTRDNDPDGALADFEAIAKNEEAPRDIRNDAKFAAARLYYERKQYDKAEKAYDSVDLPELDPGRAQIYMEKAWTYYQRKELGKAMGLLLALDAPSFKDIFLPEKYILRSLIYKDRCHYLPAKRAARDFTRKYRGALDLIRERGDLNEDPKLVQATIEQRTEAAREDAFLKHLAKEREAIDNYASRFESSGLTRHLRKIYDAAVSEATRKRTVAMRKALIDTADTLLRDEEQVRLLDYEIGLDLYKRFHKSTAPPSIEPDEVVPPGDVAYNFDGEYWNDELRDYHFFLNSRCLEVEAQQ
jgi:tetratricopeptide (TPR) repeat protein